LLKQQEKTDRFCTRQPINPDPDAILEIRIRRKIDPVFFGPLFRVFLGFAKLDSGVAVIYVTRQLRISGSLFPPGFASV